MNWQSTLSYLFISFQGYLLINDSLTQQKFSSFVDYFDPLNQLDDEFKKNVNIFFAFSMFASFYKNIWIRSYSVICYAIYLCHMHNPYLESTQGFEFSLSHFLSECLILLLAFGGLFELVDEQFFEKNPSKQKEHSFKLELKTNKKQGEESISIFKKNIVKNIQNKTEKQNASNNNVDHFKNS